MLSPGKCIQIIHENKVIVTLFYTINAEQKSIRQSACTEIHTKELKSQRPKEQRPLKIYSVSDNIHSFLKRFFYLWAERSEAVQKSPLYGRAAAAGAARRGRAVQRKNPRRGAAPSRRTGGFPVLIRITRCRRVAQLLAPFGSYI